MRLEKRLASLITGKGRTTTVRARKNSRLVLLLFFSSLKHAHTHAHTQARRDRSALLPLSLSSHVKNKWQANNVRAAFPSFTTWKSRVANDASTPKRQIQHANHDL